MTGFGEFRRVVRWFSGCLAGASAVRFSPPHLARQLGLKSSAKTMIPLAVCKVLTTMTSAVEPIF